MGDKERIGFLKTEQALGNQRISTAVSQLEKVELYAFLGCAAVYAFAFGTFTDGDNLATFPLILWLPVALVAFAILRIIMQIQYIKLVAMHLREVELKLAQLSGIEEAEIKILCWENFYSEQIHMPDLHAFFRLMLWGGLALGTTYIAFFRIGVYV